MGLKMPISGHWSDSLVYGNLYGIRLFSGSFEQISKQNNLLGAKNYLVNKITLILRQQRSLVLFTGFQFFYVSHSCFQSSLRVFWKYGSSAPIVIVGHTVLVKLRGIFHQLGNLSRYGQNSYKYMFKSLQPKYGRMGIFYTRMCCSANYTNSSAYYTFKVKFWFIIYEYRVDRGKFFKQLQRKVPA